MLESDALRRIQDQYLLHFPLCVAKPASLNITGGEIKPGGQSTAVATPGILERRDGSVSATERVIGPTEVIGLVPGVIGIEAHALFDQFDSRLGVTQGVLDQRHQAIPVRIVR